MNLHDPIVAGPSGRDQPSVWAEQARTSPDWGYDEIATGHWPMFSTPERLAEVLLKRAESGAPSAEAG